jgi:Tfp pilus assembly major pilin PilA
VTKIVISDFQLRVCARVAKIEFSAISGSTSLFASQRERRATMACPSQSGLFEVSETTKRDDGSNLAERSGRTITDIRRSGGFTLVALMIVVAIIGVLAVLGVMGYQTSINSSKIAEATHMLGAIRIAQEGIRSETGSYVNVSNGRLGVNGSNLSSCYPPGTLAYTTKVSFGG